MTKEYREALRALEAGAPITAFGPLLKALARHWIGVDSEDEFGLTISMRAAAYGRLDVLEAIYAHGAAIEKRNSKTRANLLHYAAQQPNGGSDIVLWAIIEKHASDDLLRERIFVPGEDRNDDQNWDRGNGNTVAFEAVFNNNVAVVEALLDLRRRGHKVDLEKPAVHGLSPLGWSLNTLERPIKGPVGGIAGLLLGALGRELESAPGEVAKSAKDYVRIKEEAWRCSYPRDVDAIEFANSLRLYVVGGTLGTGQSVRDLIASTIRGGLDPNGPYGRFGQPLLILIPTHPDMMAHLDDDQRERYTEVVKLLIENGADPRIKEKGLMEVSAGFREVFFGNTEALAAMIDSLPEAKRASFVAEQGLFNGYTRLIDAALLDEQRAIKILQPYADLGVRGFNGWTACDAAKNGRGADESPKLVCETALN